MVVAWKTFLTVFLVATFYNIVHSIIPSNKFELDQGFRRRAAYFADEKNLIDEIPEIWSVLLDKEMGSGMQSLSQVEILPEYYDS